MAIFGYSNRAQSQLGSSSRFAEVTPSDDFDLPVGGCRALFVCGGGDLSLVDSRGNVVRFTSTDCQYHPIRVSRVRATGTTATGIVALY